MGGLSRLVRGVGEDLPKPQCLVARPRHNRRPIWAHGEVQNSVGVSSERCDFGHARVPPKNDLVQAVSVSRNELVAVLTPLQVANLRAGIDAIERAAAESVPEPDAPVGGPTSAAQQPVLVRAPGDSLHGGGVFIKPIHGLRALQVPDKKFVVVSSAGKLTFVGAPLEAANFLLVACEFGDEGLRLMRGESLEFSGG